MNIFELILLGFAISADSFVSSLLIGIKEEKINFRLLILVAIIFATFQSLMPVLGYVLINTFSKYLVNIDHFIAFFFLLYLGINMIRDKNTSEYRGIKLSAIITLAIAVTIDAFAVGITYSILDVFIPLTLMINFSITFITTIIGILIGSRLGHLIRDKANTIGGIILIIIGIKILLSHLNIIK